MAQRFVAGAVGQPTVFEPIGYQSLGYRMKKVLLGRPLPTARLVHERLRKLVALAVFSRTPSSSTAYGTEQIMLILVTAGAVATELALPIALAIGGLLAILILSYRQTITAYPSAGGAYIVTRDNWPRAGTGRRISAADRLRAHRGGQRDQRRRGADDRVRAPAAVRPAAVTVGHRADCLGQPGRGESGRIFAVPTYLFVVSCALMLLVGLVRQQPLAPIPDQQTALLPPHGHGGLAAGAARLRRRLRRTDRGRGHQQRTRIPTTSRPRTPDGPDRHGRHPRDPVYRRQLPGRAYPCPPIPERQPDPHRAAGRLGARHLAGRPGVLLPVPGGHPGHPDPGP